MIDKASGLGKPGPKIKHSYSYANCEAKIQERYGVEGPQILVVGSCLAHLQAAADLGAQLHMVCTGRSAHLDAHQGLPPGWPPGTRAHASLGDLVDCIAPQGPPPPNAP